MLEVCFFIVSLFNYICKIKIITKSSRGTGNLAGSYGGTVSMVKLMPIDYIL